MNGTVPEADWPTSVTYDKVIFSLQCVEALPIIGGNALTLIAVRRTKKLREIPTNVFVVSLAVSDGIFGFMIPIFVGLKLLDIKQVWNGTACLLYGPYYSLFYASLLTLLAIAVDRYLAVVHPLSYRQRMTIKRAKIISVIIWIIALTLIVTPYCYYGVGNDVIKINKRVFRDIVPQNIRLFLLQMVILAPVLGNIVLYALMYIKLKTKPRVAIAQSGNTAQVNEGESSKVTKAYVNMMALVLGYLLLACLPQYILVAILRRSKSPTPTWCMYMYDASVMLFYSNPFMNPVIYSWKNRNFRQAFKKILRCEQSAATPTDDASKIKNTSTARSQV